MIKTRKQSLIIIGAFILILLLGTTTYAFFNYTRTGTANTIKVGRIVFNSEQTSINLANVFPIDSSEVSTDIDNVGTATIHISGDTEYSEGIEYLVSVVNANNKIGSGIRKKTIPLSVNITYDASEDKVVGTSDNEYFNNRGGDTTIYKVLSGETIRDGSKLIVGYIKPDQAGIDGTITIRAYIDKDKIGISDTYPSDSTGVNANGYGFNPNMSSEARNYCISYLTDQGYANPKVYTVNPNATADDINACIDFFDRNNVTLLDGDNIQDFCSGTGTYYGETLQTYIDNSRMDTYVGRELIRDHLILASYANVTVVENFCDGTGEMSNMTFQQWLDNSKFGSYTINQFLSNDVIIEWTNDTSSEWANGRTILTTEEWNSFNSNGLSFKIKVEANEGIWVPDPSFLYNMIKDNSELDTNIDYSIGFYRNPVSGIYMLNGTANDKYPTIFYRGIIDDNNVFFANSCWQMVRTTSTGGVKLLYNGPNTGTSAEPKCESTYPNYSIGRYNFVKGWVYGGPGHSGYMHGNDYYIVVSGEPAQDALFGSTFEYDDFDNDGTGEYKLSGSVDVGKANDRHYTCNSSDINGTCAEIRFYHASSYYILLKDGKNIATALEEMFENNLDSNVKEIVDNWYAANMTSYTSKLEDTVYCADRRIYDYGGWSETGISNSLQFTNRKRTSDGNPSLECRLQDSFTVDEANGNGKLTYPVGLITVDEALYAGASTLGGDSRIYVSTSGADYWTMSPSYTFYDGAGGTYLTGGLITTGSTNYSRLVRPMVSLKYGAKIVSGEGTKTNPYVVE